MSKRKGKTLGVGYGGKRFRENGRLKLQQSNFDDELEDKMLKDAGFDAETMKAISGSEREAIIKAIMDSNQAKDFVLIESSDSDSKESTSAKPSLNEMETQPSSVSFDEVGEGCSRKAGSGSNSPNSPESYISSGSQHEGSAASQYESNNGSSSTLKRLISTRGEERDGNSKSNHALSDDTTQPYQDEEDPLSVLAAETQALSPELRVKGKPNRLDVISESSSPVSPDNNDKKDERNKENAQDTHHAFLNRIYPARMTSAASDFGDFLPRYSPGTVRNSDLYTQVLNSMLGIYLQRLRVASGHSKEKPVKWGNPVKTGLHCENLLLRKTFGANEKGGGKNGRDRRRIIKRDDMNASDFLSVPNNDKGNTESSKGARRPSAPGDTKEILSGDGTNVKYDTIATMKVFDLNDDSSSDFDHPETSKKNNDDMSIPKDLNSNIRSRTKKKNEDVPNTSKYKIKDIQSYDQSPRSSPLPSMNCESENTIPPLEIEVYDDNPSPEPKSNTGSWLRTANSHGKRKVNETKRCNKKARPDSPQVKSILKRKGRRRDINQKTISEVFIAEKDVMCESAENFNGTSTCYQKSKLEFETIQEDEEEMRWLNENSKVKDDLPSSIDSTYNLLNSQGDMYSTQMTDLKLLEKKKREGKGVQVVDCNTLPNVVIRSGPRQEFKKKASSVAEIEMVEDCSFKIDTAKADKVDEQTASTDISCMRLKALWSKRKKTPPFVEDAEFFEGFDNGSSNPVIGNTKGKKFELTVTHSNESGERSQTMNHLKDGVEVEILPVVENSIVCEIKANGKRKNRKRIFDDSNYAFLEESPMQDCNVNYKKGKRGRNKKNVPEDSGPSSDNKIVLGEAGVPASLSKEEDSEEGTCPICTKTFKLNELEAHASTCGEGLTEDDLSLTVECMICNKHIERDILKDHQTKCSVLRMKDEVATKRVTRAKNSSASINRRKNIVREKSPSSSGDDYEDLIIEVDKQREIQSRNHSSQY